jgi:ATP synthase protein I
MPDAEDPKRTLLTTTASGYGDAFGFIGTILVFTGLGWLIDRWLHSLPWGLVIGLCLGFFGATYKLVRDSKRNAR